MAAFGLIASAGLVKSQAPTESPWEVVDRGLFYRVWQKTVSRTDPDTGEPVERHRQYTELANGLHYREDGQWKEFQDLIEPAEVGAVARKGPHQVIFSSNVNAPVVIDHMTHAGNRFQSRVVGLYYFDAATGQSAQIATIQNSQGRLLPPNRVLYADAFDGVEADLLYTYTKSRFEQDVILLEEPAPPEAFGLDPETTRFEVWTEFVNPPQPQKRTVVLDRETDPQRRQQMVEPDLVDEILFFGDTWFPVGNAFRFDVPSTPGEGEPAPIRRRNPNDPDVLPIGKQWRQIDGRTILIESVDYIGLLEKMADFLQARGPQTPRNLNERVAQGRQLPSHSPADSPDQPLLVAENSYRPDGVVLDLVTESGTANSYTFTNGHTFHITDDFTVGPDEATFEPGCVIKFDFMKDLTVTGSYSFPETQQTPVFTAKNDDGYGEDIDPQVSDPIQSASPALWSYFIQQSMTVQNAQFRWCLTGIEYDEDGTVTHNLEDSRFKTTQTGVSLDSNTSLVLSDVKKCDVDTEIYGSGATQGSMTKAPLCLETSFSGINVADDFIFRPPDTMGAIGPNHFVEITNGKIVVFDRLDGERLDEMVTRDFFGVSEVTDPRIVYDHASQRWVACVVNKDTYNVPLAISDSDNPVSLKGRLDYSHT